MSKFVMLISIFAWLGFGPRYNCPEAEITNYTGVWDAYDEQTLDKAQGECVDKYNGRSPCVTEFIKKRGRRYQVKCGAEKNG